MNVKTPEQAGLSSVDIQKYIDFLEQSRFSSHCMVIARGDDIIFEKYWEGFGPDYLHRQYSASKSIVGIAVGFAIQDGYFSLDDKMIDLFPEELKNQPDENIRNQTVRNMLMMSTSHVDRGWFAGHTCTDRVQHYFDSQDPATSHPAGTIFCYDSEGSFVLGALVERKVGKPFMDYLREKLFDKIGVSKEAYCLKCPGGHSWGDSAVICSSRDLLLMARFMMNKGKWNGEQLLDEKYVIDATSKLTAVGTLNEYTADRQGYGYLIWRTYDNGWFFNGMGSQFAIAVPDKDLIMVYNADNQGMSHKEPIIGGFFDMIARKIQDEPMPENPEALAEASKTLPLMTAKGEMDSEWRERVNGVTYNMAQNNMGITKLSLHFEGDEGEMRYTNAQGDKVIRFGFGRNIFEDKFPQEGYSDDVGGVETKNYYYKYAASAAWTNPWQLHLKVQIVDKYFGRLDIVLSFAEGGRLTVQMTKTAEDFLNEYKGWAQGRAE